MVHGCCSLSVYIQGTSDDRTHGPYEQLGVGAISIFGLVTSLSRATFEVADKKEKEREKVLTNIFGAVPFLSILFLPSYNPPSIFRNANNRQTHLNVYTSGSKRQLTDVVPTWSK